MSSTVGVFRSESERGLNKGLKAKRQRALGIYYTPIALSEAIAHWAVRDCTDTILEPSFGGCAFLAAARQRLQFLGTIKPDLQLAGCDIDEAAFSTLHSIAGKRPSPSRYLKQNFLSVEPGGFPISEFTCVLGNPPFVRHHDISNSVKRSIAKLALSSPMTLPRTAGLWAHFVAHSMSFLARNGRMGLVLPSSLMFADYAKPLREVIRQNLQKWRAPRGVLASPSGVDAGEPSKRFRTR